MEHQITRHRHELKRRQLTLRQTSRVTPNMIRLVFAGDELGDFASLGFDDHVKIFVPTGRGDTAMRDYTPRAFDRDARTLTLDFAVHEAGPATRWALAARPGDRLEIGGPRGSMVVAPTFDWWLLIGDETALPAIGRRLEELPAGAKVISIVAVAGTDEEQRLAGPVDHQAIWAHRPLDRADDPGPLLEIVRGLTLPAGDGFIWIAAEASVARTVRSHFLGLGHRKEWLKAAGYWRKGVADAHEKLED